MSWSVALAVVLMIAPQSATTGDHADSAIEQAQLRQFAPEVAQSWSFADEPLLQKTHLSKEHNSLCSDWKEPSKPEHGRSGTTWLPLPEACNATTGYREFVARLLAPFGGRVSLDDVRASLNMRPHPFPEPKLLTFPLRVVRGRAVEPVPGFTGLPMNKRHPRAAHAMLDEIRARAPRLGLAWPPPDFELAYIVADAPLKHRDVQRLAKLRPSLAEKRPKEGFALIDGCAVMTTKAFYLDKRSLHPDKWYYFRAACCARELVDFCTVRCQTSATLPFLVDKLKIIMRTMNIASELRP